MPRRAKVMAPSLTDETRSMLAVLARSRTAPAHHVERVSSVKDGAITLALRGKIFRIATNHGAA